MGAGILRESSRHPDVYKLDLLVAPPGGTEGTGITSSTHLKTLVIKCTADMVCTFSGNLCIYLYNV